jgi:hypothetical protein
MSKIASEKSEVTVLDGKIFFGSGFLDFLGKMGTWA